ncbi:MAG TPA: hypothetical protein VJ697_11850 [Nitrososphaeraceae archaeon]|nr:hypothetical protein [Nitrososphaeraceae archaeon]
MNKVVITIISSIMTFFILMGIMANPVLASVDEDEGLDREDYDPTIPYDKEDCAEMFDPEYDREGFQTCSGGIGIPNPGP